MNQVQVGLIGAGAFGESHIVGYKSLPYANLAAVCDTNATRAQELAARYDIPKWYVDYTELLREIPLDAVSICTPEELHLAPALAAIGAGKHVLVEKPIATRVEDAKQMIEAPGKTGIQLFDILTGNAEGARHLQHRACQTQNHRRELIAIESR